VKVAVLGAGGTIGPAIARDLAGSEEVAELQLLDLDAARAVAVADAIGSAKVRAGGIDAGDAPACARAIGDADAVVNSVSYRLNRRVMEACLEAGCHYFDLGGLYWMTAEQLRTFAPPGGEDRFAAAGLVAVLGIGSSPGKTNLMAVHAARELSPSPGRPGREAEYAAGPGTPGREAEAPASPGRPGREAEDLPGVDYVHVAAAGRDLDPPPGFSVPYALRTLVDELTLPPVVIRDGEAVEIEPLSPGGMVDFGEPIGEAETIHTLHSEMLTFPDSFGCRDASFRLSLHPELLERLGELATASEDELARTAAEARPPSPETVSVHVIDAARGGRSVRVRSVTRPVPGLGLGGGVVSTAAPAAAAVRLLARGSLSARGVHPPERCIEPDELFAELRSRGSVFDVAVRSEADPAIPRRGAQEVASR
jgi:lysine 6-dehydrogenase